MKLSKAQIDDAMYESATSGLADLFAFEEVERRIARHESRAGQRAWETHELSDGSKRDQAHIRISLDDVALMTSIDEINQERA